MEVINTQTYEDALAWYENHPAEIASGYVFSKQCLCAYVKAKVHLLYLHSIGTIAVQSNTVAEEHGKNIVRKRLCQLVQVVLHAKIGIQYPAPCWPTLPKWGCRRTSLTRRCSWPAMNPPLSRKRLCRLVQVVLHAKIGIQYLLHREIQLIVTAIPPANHIYLCSQLGQQGGQP